AYTVIPDANFLQALKDLGHGEGAVGNHVPTANLKTITSLDIADENISNLTGIEDFVALKTLTCNFNNLTSLDLSKNIALTSLDCSINKLSMLNISGCTALISLECSDNEIASVNLSANPNLTEVHFYNNKLSSFDIRNNNNGKITRLDVIQNPDLTCIYVDDKNAIPSNWTKDVTSSYANDESECSTPITQISAEQFTFYPNPTSGIINLDLQGKRIQNLKIVDVTGKIISEKNHVNSTETIDLSNFSNGLYLVILQSENGTQSFKVVKE
ncbi:MAG: T9SS type A sorting domain-containing protein, partial [Paludibacteraceae bacterium]|nr:T9SS type A sorting domain-containing protein [Paludibacteraceae bacterium]